MTAPTPPDHAAERNLVLVLDPAGNALYLSAELQRKLGYDAEGIAALTIKRLRHSDMPELAFRAYGEFTGQGKSWNGVFVLQRADGNGLWLECYAIPVVEAGALIETHLVFQPPPPKVIERTRAHYLSFQRGKPTSFRERKLDLPYRVALALLAPVIAWAVAVYGRPFSGAAAAGFGAALALGGAATWWLSRDYLALMARFRQTPLNPNKLYLFTGRADDTARIEFALHSARTGQHALLINMQDALRQIEARADGTIAMMLQTVRDISAQQEDLAAVSEASSRFAAATADLSQHCDDSLAQVRQARDAAGDGASQVSESVQTMQDLSSRIADSSRFVAALHSQGESISQFMEVIRGIAEQTNLLALNAAIEAARAGENGRGFAVVADEVRHLAVRAQEATEEIDKLMQEMQRETRQMVQSMEQVQTMSHDSQAQVEGAGEALRHIAEVVSQIHELAGNIAAAATDQREETASIDQRIQRITASAEAVVAEAQETQSMNNDAGALARKQADVVERMLAENG